MKRRQRQWIIVILATFCLFFLLFKLGPPTLLGFVIFTSSLFIPTEAIDQLGNNQISPDGGTVDVSDNTYVQLTYGTNAFVTVSRWNLNITNESQVTNVNLTCEIDLVGGRGEVLIFGYNTTSTGWNNVCNQSITAAGTYWCNLFSQGIDTASEVLNLDTRCIVGDNNGGTAAYIRLDATKLAVNASVIENKSTATGKVTLHVDTSIVLTVTDTAIDFGSLGINDNVSSEGIRDWFNISNDGSVNFDVSVYGNTSPFSSTTNGANTLPNDFYLVHANSSKSGIANTNYVPVPKNITTKTLVVSNLENTDGVDTAAIGIRVVVPSDESSGSKSADLIIFVEPS